MWYLRKNAFIVAQNVKIALFQCILPAKQAIFEYFPRTASTGYIPSLIRCATERVRNVQRLRRCGFLLFPASPPRTPLSWLYREVKHIVAPPARHVQDSSTPPQPCGRPGRYA